MVTGGHRDASEMLVEDGKFEVIGQNLPEASEVIDLAGAWSCQLILIRKVILMRDISF